MPSTHCSPRAQSACSLHSHMQYEFRHLCPFGQFFPEQGSGIRTHPCIAVGTPKNNKYCNQREVRCKKNYQIGTKILFYKMLSDWAHFFIFFYMVSIVKNMSKVRGNWKTFIKQMFSPNMSLLK